jgi:aminopeptidase N
LQVFNKESSAVLGTMILLLIVSAVGCVFTPANPQTTLNWDDLSIYETNLIQDEQYSLESLQDASVYHLDLTISPDFQSISGTEQVRYTNQETVDLPSIYFRLFPNESGGHAIVSAVTVDDKTVALDTFSSSTALKITLNQPLKPETALTIEFDFKVEMPASTQQSFGLLGYSNGVLALDSFFPIIPVYDDKGWHIEPSDPDGDKTYNDTSFFLATVTAPAGVVLVASGVEVNRSSQGSSQTVTYADGPARDFYLAASDEFTRISTKIGETTINSYYLAGEQSGAQKILSVAADAVRVFGNRFGPYPYTEFDVVPLALSGGGIGMEYPGVVGIAMSIYDNQNVLETTVAHETGHQWFYNVVGNDQVNQPWLDESTTQYITGLYYLDVHGQAGWDASKAEWNSFWSRTGKLEIPIGKPVSSYPGNMYGAIVYGRGPLFMVALADDIGAAFPDCLRRYYQDFKWGITTSTSFEVFFQTCSGRDLTAIFQKWVLP